MQAWDFYLPLGYPSYLSFKYFDGKYRIAECREKRGIDKERRKGSMYTNRQVSRAFNYIEVIHQSSRLIQANLQSIFVIRKPRCEPPPCIHTNESPENQQKRKFKLPSLCNEECMPRMTPWTSDKFVKKDQSSWVESSVSMSPLCPILLLSTIFSKYLQE